MASWWADPMPSGWEAKWDPGQNRYFFIDHTTKKTSWIDPRSPEGKSQVARPVAQPARQQYGYGGTSAAASAIPMQSVRPKCGTCFRNEVSRAGEKCASCRIKTAAKCSICDTNVVKESGDVCQQCLVRYNANDVAETSFNQAADPDLEELAGLFVRADEKLVKKLKGCYPSAIESHVRSALESNDNDEGKACRDLDKRGYKKVQPKELTAAKLMEKLRPKYPDCPEGVLKSTIMSADCDEKLTITKLKDLGFLTYQQKQEKEKEEREAKKMKQEVERNFRREFPNLDSDIITMALETANYDEQLAKTVLTQLTQEEEQAASSTPAPPAAATSSPAKQPTIGKGKSPAKSVKNPAKVKAEQPAVVKPERPQTKRSDVKKTEPSAKSAPTKSYGGASGKAIGPNPNLPQGPQDHLLLKGYCDVFGSNKDIVRGPTCHAMGSQGAFGPDPSLVHGPGQRHQAIYV